MKKIVLLLFFFASLITAQKELVSVKLLVECENLDEGEKIYITGNQPLIGGWKADGLELKKLSKNRYGLEGDVPKGLVIEYKFTKGSWETEAVSSEGVIPDNYKLVVTKDTVVTHVITNWKDEFENVKPAFEGQITGSVQYHKNFTYKNLKPRDIIVWLPPDYEKNVDKKYPVLYMHDGQNIIDPATANFGVDWQIDETATNLINQNKIEPLIIVGINNTSDRRTEYSHTELGKTYMEFIVNKLKPFIDENYRTLKDRENTAVGGSSMGGLISFMMVWEYSSIFSKAICMSPAFKIDGRDINYVRRVRADKMMRPPIEIYIDNGGKELEKILAPGIDEMITVLVNRGFRLNENLFVEFDFDAAHFESAWAERMHIPLIEFFGK